VTHGFLFCKGSGLSRYHLVRKCKLQEKVNYWSKEIQTLAEKSQALAHCQVVIVNKGNVSDISDDKSHTGHQKADKPSRIHSPYRLFARGEVHCSFTPEAIRNFRCTLFLFIARDEHPTHLFCGLGAHPVHTHLER
jgi:hypothetical protein